MIMYANARIRTEEHHELVMELIDGKVHADNVLQAISIAKEAAGRTNSGDVWVSITDEEIIVSYTREVPKAEGKAQCRCMNSEHHKKSLPPIVLPGKQPKATFEERVMAAKSQFTSPDSPTLELDDEGPWDD